MSTISKPTRELYANIRSEVIGLHFRQLLIRQLFTSKDTNDLLNKAALRFFTTLKWDLLDTITITISRLTDPSKSLKKFSNASLQQLVDSLDASNHTELVRSLIEIYKQIKAKSARIESWRKKWAAHRDLEVVQGIAPKPLISMPEIDEVLGLIGRFLNEFERICQDQVEYVYDDSETPEEFAHRVSEGERLKIYPPIPYENRHYLPDDGNTIIALIKKANSSSN